MKILKTICNSFNKKDDDDIFLIIKEKIKLFPL